MRQATSWGFSQLQVPCKAAPFSRIWLHSFPRLFLVPSTFRYVNQELFLVWIILERSQRPALPRGFFDNGGRGDFRKEGEGDCDFSDGND